MSVAQNQTITKSDVSNLFITNLKNTLVANTYHSGNMAYFTTPSGGNVMPTDQYGSSNFDNLNITDTIISSNLYTILVNLVKTYTRIRKVTSSSYLFSQSTTTGDHPAYSESDTLQETKSNMKIIFAATVPSVSGDTRPFYRKNPNDTNMLKDISPVNPGITQNQTILASHITSFFTNLKTAWDNIYNNNTITFEYHYCHSNWNSWSSRARR